MNCRTQGFLVLHYLPESAQTRVHWVSDSIQPPHPLLPPFPPALNLLNFRVFSNELVLCIRWPNISASASVLPMNIQDWFLLRLAGLISLLQGTPWHHNLKSSVLQCPAFFLWPNSFFFHAEGSSVPIISHFTILPNLTSAAQGRTNLFSISMDFILDQFSSVTQLCLTPCNPMDCSTLGFPVYHQLPEAAQTHVHQVGDAIQPSHLLPSPSPPAFNLSSIRVFQWVSSSHQVAKVLKLQHQSFQWIFRTDSGYFI